MVQAGLPLPIVAKSIQKLTYTRKEQFFKDLDIRILNVPESNAYKLEFPNLSTKQRKQLEMLAFQIQDGSISVDEAILQIRGGDFSDSAKELLGYLLAIVLVSGAMNSPEGKELWHKIQQSFSEITDKIEALFGAEGFTPKDTSSHQQNRHGAGLNWDGPDWGGGSLGNKNPSRKSPSPAYPSRELNYPSTRRSTKLALMQKPAAMDQSQYSPLPTAQKTQLDDPLGRDRFIQRSGKPRLDVLYNRAYHKCPDHGTEAGLPLKPGSTKVERSEQNVEIFRDFIVDIGMDESPRVQWFENGGYQTNTPRGCEAINLYDYEKDLICVYRKRPDGRNILETVLTPTDAELQHFFASDGHFVSDPVLKDPNWQGPNPNWKGFSESNFPTTYKTYNPSSSGSDGFTPINTFESDVMGITPAQDSDSQNNP